MVQHLPLIRLQPANKNREMHQEKSLLLHVGRAVNDTTHASVHLIDMNVIYVTNVDISYCHHLESQPSNQSQKTSFKFSSGKIREKPHQKRSKSNSVSATFKVDFEYCRKYITVSVNNVPICLKVDTATDITLISPSTWEQIGLP